MDLIKVNSNIVQLQAPERRTRMAYKILFAALVLLMLSFAMSSTVYASSDGTMTSASDLGSVEKPGADSNIWQWADNAMKDVYGKISAISTTVACCMAAVALLVMNFSSSGKAVDEARSWFKRILITWAIINVLGFVMTYLKPLVEGGNQIK